MVALLPAIFPARWARRLCVGGSDKNARVAVKVLLGRTGDRDSLP